MDLKEIGIIVGTEIHGLTSWDGATVTYWGIFDCDPNEVKLFELRKHLIEAVSLEEGQPTKDSILVHSLHLD